VLSTLADVTFDAAALRSIALLAISLVAGPCCSAAGVVPWPAGLFSSRIMQRRQLPAAD
jgi:hypothetical protein